MKKIAVTALIGAILFVSLSFRPWAAEPMGSAQEVSYANVVCDPGFEVDPWDGVCRKACQTATECLSGERCTGLPDGFCSKDCPAQTIQTVCGPINIPFMQTHTTSGLFIIGIQGNVSCHNGQIKVQFTTYGDNCAPRCGDGECRGFDEDCQTCPSDCGACSSFEPSVIINPPPMSIPVRGQPEVTKLEASDVIFQWSSGHGLGSYYRLEVGTCQDKPECASDIFRGDNPSYIFMYPEPRPEDKFPNVNSFAHKVNGIPLNGRPVYVRLTQLKGVQPYVTMYRYDTKNLNPHIVFPEPGTVLNEVRPLFTCEGQGIVHCQFFAGTKNDRKKFGAQTGNFIPQVGDPDAPYQPYIPPVYKSTVLLPLNGEDVYVTLIASLAGNQKVRVKAKYPTINCGDRKIGPGESCDDGNRLDNDGCSSICQQEFRRIFR